MNSDVNMIDITLKKRLRFMLHAYCGKKAHFKLWQEAHKI